MILRSLRWVLLLLAILMVGSVPVVAQPVSLDVQTPNRFVVPGAEFSFAVRVRGFADMSESARLGILGRLALSFPGFEASAKPAPDSQGLVTFRGRIKQPGFFPFEVSLRGEGETSSARDYFVVLPGRQAGVFNHIGFYSFLGRGDYWDPTHKLALWKLEDWMDFVDWMADHQADTLYVALNGYTLAYPSQKYPELRDPYALNVKLNFLGKLIDYAHGKGVKVSLLLATDDHADGFGKLHPESVRVNRDGHISSPRALCLENPRAQQYILDMFEETLSLYPKADGVIIHPTEESPERYNEETKALFHKETGTELVRAGKNERFRWYNQKFAEFAVKLYNLVKSKNPAMDFIMANCWWQDDWVPIYRKIFPDPVRICVWYYGWDQADFQKWPIWNWTEAFGADRIIYMPTGPAFLYPADPWQQMERHIGTDRLVSTVEAFGVKSCVFFAGWDVGTERDRLRDLVIAQFPATARAGDRDKKLEWVKKLYDDYFGARKSLLQ